jgi:hypothetical protein
MMSVATVAFGPKRWAIHNAATIFAPDDVPAIIPLPLLIVSPSISLRL